MDLLVVSAGTSVTSPEAGDEVRAWNIISGLAKNGWDITVAENPGGDPDVDEAKVVTFKDVLPPRLNDFNPFLFKLLVKQFRDQPPDIVHVKTFAGVTASKFVSLIFNRDSAVVYDAQNFETGKIKDARVSLPVHKRIVAPYLIPVLESLSVRVADHVTAVSEKDRQAFQNRFGLSEAEISVIPSGSSLADTENADVSRFKSRHNLPQEVPLIVFHGYFDYPPNREAIETIANEIAPELNEDGVDHHIAIAGKNVPAFPEHESVTGLGFVEDLDTFLSAADIAVVPLHRGGGTKLKVLDYLCAGLPIVTTETGAEGLDIRDGETALVFQKVGDEFINGISRLIDSPELRLQLGTNARELAENNYTWDQIVSRVDSLYRSLRN